MVKVCALRSGQMCMLWEGVRVFLEMRVKNGWMWPPSSLGSSSQASSFFSSPLCFPFALNEASNSNLNLEPIFPFLERCFTKCFSFFLPKVVKFALCHCPCQLASSLPHKLQQSSTKDVCGPRGTPYNKISPNSQNDQNTLGFLKCK